jgi:hypothetical protein
VNEFTTGQRLQGPVRVTRYRFGRDHLSTNLRFPSNSDRKFSAWGFVAMCHLRPKFDRKFEPNNGRRDLFKFHLRFDRD